MDIEKLKVIVSNTKPKGLSIKLKNKHTELYQNILQYQKDNNCLNLSEAIYRIIHSISSIPLCPKCDSNVKFLNVSDGYQSICGKCAGPENLKKTMLEKYGVDNIAKLKETQEKKKQTCLEKYGVESHNQLDSVKQKKKETLFNNYGDDGLSNKLIYNKRVTTCLDRYGVSHHTKLQEVQNKKKQTCLTKYGVDNVMNHSDISKKVSESMFDREQFLDDIKKLCDSKNFELVSDYKNSHSNIKLKCNKCDTIWSILWNSFQQGNGVCPTCYPSHKGVSKAEKDILQFIKSLNVNVIENDKSIISPYELDIVIPDKKIAIEYCGLWYHSTIGNGKFKKDKNYHLSKLKMCEENGYKLITIFEDEWLSKTSIVKSMLRSKLEKISIHIKSEDCKIKILQSSTKKEFFSKYHLEGDTVSSKNYGLYHNNKLISAISFKQTDSRNGIWKLERYCCIPFLNVIDGLHSLIFHFQTNNIWNEIYTISDKRWESGSMYTKLNFNYVSDIDPTCWYWGKGIKGRCTKSQYINENMELDGILWIYDCGNVKFNMTNEYV